MDLRRRRVTRFRIATFVMTLGRIRNSGAVTSSYPQYSNIFNNFEAKGTAYYQSCRSRRRNDLSMAVVPGRLYPSPGSGITPAADSAALRMVHQQI